jgi:hypothetical protein
VATAGAKPGWQGAAGDIVATAADTSRFAHALFTGTLLDQGGLDEMLDFEATRSLPGTIDCAAQSAVGRRQSSDLPESWFQGGNAGLFRSWLEHFPSRGVTVTVIVNSNTFPVAFVERLAREALADAPVVRPAAAGGRCNTDIAVGEADGSVRRLTSGPDFEGLPSWSPDGTRLVWVANRNRQNDIYVAARDRTTPVALTNDSAHDVFPRWSPDGTAIAFSSDRDGDQEIYLMAPDGSNVSQLTHNDWDDWMGDWSPDGSRIAYVSAHEGQHLRVMAADGRSDRDVTAGDVMPSADPKSTSRRSCSR